MMRRRSWRGGEVLVGEDSGATVVPGWASGMVAGPANEAGQGLHFEVVSNDNPGLFAGMVVVDALSGDVGFTPGPDAVGSALVGVVLVDDGVGADGGVDTSPLATLRITVSPVNDPPSFTAGPDITGVEDSGPVVVSGWAGVSTGPADEAGQAALFSIVSNSNPGLFTAGPAIAVDGTLSYAPAPNANGTALLVAVLTDDGGMAGGGEDTSPPAIFAVTVLPVNDAPWFVAGGDVGVAADSGMYSAGWASGMVAGPADEAGQGLWLRGGVD